MRHLLFVLFACLPLLAQIPGPAGKEMIAEYDHATGQILKLAEATPAEKYAWRPAPGVRSVSEVYMHIATGNQLILSMAGVGKTDIAGARKQEQTVTKKEDVVAALKSAIDLGHEAIASATPEQLAKPAKFFGRDTTVFAIYLRMLVHVNEHMGQAVAYARVNGIVPPWSQRAEK